MSKNTISVDDFLNQSQSESSQFLALVEENKADPSKVKVTPYLSDKKCGCSGSLLINKDAIENLELTDLSHLCCGKNHKVVKINFKEGYTISLEDVFKQYLENSNQPSHHDQGFLQNTPSFLPNIQAGASDFKFVGPTSEENSIDKDQCVWRTYYTQPCNCVDRWGNRFTRNAECYHLYTGDGRYCRSMCPSCYNVCARGF